MELKEFIKETISQIDGAIRELNRDCEVVVNPHDEKSKSFATQDGKSYNLTTISFHIELAILQSDMKKGGIEVLPSIVKLGGKVEKGEQASTNTAIDFHLNVLFEEGRVKTTSP